jgi:hypothetical protein
MYWLQLSGKKLCRKINTYNMICGVRLIMVSNSDFHALKFFFPLFLLFYSPILQIYMSAQQVQFG